jgi:hypothetical protein
MANLLYLSKERRPIASIYHYERIGRPLGKLLYPFKERRPIASINHCERIDRSLCKFALLLNKLFLLDHAKHIYIQIKN